MLCIIQGPTVNGQLQNNPVGAKFISAIQKAFQDNYNISIPQVIDYNTANGSFVSNLGQFSINPETLQRCSSSIGLLATPLGHSLDIRLDSQLLKIGFCGTKAKSITYLHKGNICTIKARKKIILCAGHNTPAILLQNGLGDAALLESLNIEVVKNNPEVGKNLKNHIFLPFIITINPEDAATIASYPLAFKRLSGVAALPEPGNSNSEGRDYQTSILSVGGNIALLIIVFVNPESTGTVTIVDKDPLMPPVVTLNYLTQQADRTSMVNAVTIAGQIMAELHAIDPTYNLISNISDPVAYVNANTSAFHHWHGQCIIDKVVDKNLQVLGTENLMIADLSMFPLTDGNTQSLAYSAGCVAYTLITGDRNISFT